MHFWQNFEANLLPWGVPHFSWKGLQTSSKWLRPHNCSSCWQKNWLVFVFNVNSMLLLKKILLMYFMNTHWRIMVSCCAVEWATSIFFAFLWFMTSKVQLFVSECSSASSKSLASTNADGATFSFLSVFPVFASKDFFLVLLLIFLEQKHGHWQADRWMSYADVITGCLDTWQKWGVKMGGLAVRWQRCENAGIKREWWFYF